MCQWIIMCEVPCWNTIKNTCQSWPTSCRRTYIAGQHSMAMMECSASVTGGQVFLEKSLYRTVCISLLQHYTLCFKVCRISISMCEFEIEMYSLPRFNCRHIPKVLEAIVKLLQKEGCVSLTSLWLIY